MNSAIVTGPHASAPKPIEEARTKTAQVQQELALAEAELHLTNTVLSRALPDKDRQDDVKKAVRQNATIEEKVGEAAGELKEVTDLLEAEVAERERLELDLERRSS